jgi:hypothetical protein
MRSGARKRSAKLRSRRSSTSSQALQSLGLGKDEPLVFPAALFRRLGSQRQDRRHGTIPGSAIGIGHGGSREGCRPEMGHATRAARDQVLHKTAPDLRAEVLPEETFEIAISH